MSLRGLPSTLPEYLATLPRLCAEINDRNFEPNHHQPDFDELVKLKLRATNTNFNLPSELRELIWRQRKR